MRTVSIHQPHYLIWLGLLDKIAKSDLFVLLDSVQYKKRNFQNRTQYSTKDGSKLLSLPVNGKGAQPQNTPIKNIRISDHSALKKHLTTLKHRYGKTPGWHLIKEQLQDIYSLKHESLVDINRQLLDLTLSCYQINTPVINSSDLNVYGKKNELLVDILQKVDADIYLSGNGARSYMNPNQFNEANIKVNYQDFEHPIYNQGLPKQFCKACFALEWYFLDPIASVDHFSDSSSPKGSI